MPELPTKPFGASANRCTAISMGCGFPFGFGGYERAVQAIRRALDLGINYFDTSPLYRSGASQAIVGEALDGATRPHMLATKIGHFKEARHFRSIDAMQAQFRENLRLLRRESVDVLQIHEADWDNWWTDRADVGVCELFDEQRSYEFTNAPVIQFLRDAKSRGLCRHIGIAGNNARHLGRLIAELDGIDSVLVAYNYMPLNASARKHVIPAAQAKGMAVIVAGLLTFVWRIPEGWRTEGTYFGKHSDHQLAQLQALQKQCGIGMPELVIRWAATDARITALLVGACLPEEVEQNVTSFLTKPLPSEIHAAVEQIAAQFD